jgi:hypothetical protein
MNDYRYTLEPYNGIKTRYHCPNCNKKGVFTRYIDTQTKEHVNDNVGKCNRVIKCGYHLTPQNYFEINNIQFDKSNYIPQHPKPKPVTSYIDVEVMNKSKSSKKPNYFIDYLASLWDYDVAYHLADKYNIGTSKHWNGANVFWQCDGSNNVRTGKIMLYNASTGKRVKEPYNHINWAHNALKLPNFNLQQCLFGLHLINENTSKPIAIVESEKTSIIASVYLPEFIWLACGSANNLNEAKTKALKGRQVVLFPDLGCYDLWNSKIPKLSKLASFRTSNLLEAKATASERLQGYDLADYLVKIKNDLVDN